MSSPEERRALSGVPPAGSTLPQTPEQRAALARQRIRFAAAQLSPVRNIAARPWVFLGVAFGVGLLLSRQKGLFKTAAGGALRAVRMLVLLKLGKKAAD
jgi:hypothetical protein